MAEYSHITEFGKILIFLIMGIIFVLLAFVTNKFIAPHKPNPEKNTSYECGEEVTGSSWVQFNSRFYVIALIFLLFDVEMIFIFPWAVVFSNPELIAQDYRWGWLSFTEMIIFITILLLGLVYVWKKKDLNWIKPVVYIPKTDSTIPSSAYQELNHKTYIPGLRKEKLKEIDIKNPDITAKPQFTPRFKRQ